MRYQARPIGKCSKSLQCVKIVGLGQGGVGASRCSSRVAIGDATSRHAELCARCEVSGEFDLRQHLVVQTRERFFLVALALVTRVFCSMRNLYVYLFDNFRRESQSTWVGS